jgi:hypothetical protein
MTIFRSDRSKRVLFEKKNQKTFLNLMRKDPVFPHQTNEVFLLLFLQKKKALLPRRSPLRRARENRRAR